MFALCCYAENAAGEGRATGINERRSGSVKGAHRRGSNRRRKGGGRKGGRAIMGPAIGAGAYGGGAEKSQKKTGAPGRAIPV